MPSYITISHPRKKLSETFRDAYIEIAARQKNAQATVNLLNDLLKQDNMMYSVNLDLNVWSPAHQDIFRTWCKNIHRDFFLLKAKPSISEDQPADKAVEIFLAHKYDVAETKEIVFTAARA